MRLLLPLSLLPAASAAAAGSFEAVGDTLVSAMMMFLGSNDKVYIIDKAEGNAAQVNGHAAWGSVWDMATRQTTVMDILTNTFCSSGFHLPNGSFVTFGGNGAAGPGGNEGSLVYPGGSSASWDVTYQDFDGALSIRLLNPCDSSQDFTAPECQWFDNPAVLAMQAKRWYSTAEALANGTIAIIGFILRNFPNGNPHDGAELTYEFFPSNGRPPQGLDFLVQTSGLNAYPHTMLLSSGQMFMQANVSTMIWNYETNTETALPDMPHNVVRVYPASGATAMLPMTPANNYSQTIIFCGGSDMPDEAWGNFSYPYINTWDYPASKDYDDMPEGRTMGQFILLPDGKLLVVNGGLNGTAGFGHRNLLTPEDEMPFGQSFASGPVGTPAIYDPEAPAGSRWSNAGLATSSIARLYHSSAILLSDASVFVAGSNPNLDVQIENVPFPTQYTAEKFYPPYFAATTRPAPSGMPSKLTYGGSSFDITIPASSYSGAGNAAANATKVTVVRGGWTTHGMNMGQRYMQLKNTYTVNKDGSIILHVAQMPPNPNLFQPGPALLFVVVNVTGRMLSSAAALSKRSPLQTRLYSQVSVLTDASGSASSSSTGNGNGGSNSSTSTSHVALIAGIAGGVGVVALLAIGVGICLSRRRRARIRASIAASKAAQAPAAPYQKMPPNSDSQLFLNQNNESKAWGNQPEWNASSPSFQPYHDDNMSAHPPAHYEEYKPNVGGYSEQPRY
ncbi:glyoxal oxidase N-terminus-domain-containing protein [Mycena filopes]|nr:glyoxal oxidase N-terminus-domain-containing protein [Mycena filopes]